MDMKANVKFIVSAAFLIGVVATAFSNGQTQQQPIRVSIIQSIATPEKYHNKRISVAGYYHGGIESSGIYLSREDAEFLILENSIWIGSRGASADIVKIEAINDTFVRVEGRFVYHKKGGGHLRLWPGEINDITLFVKLPMTSHQKEPNVR